MFIKKKAVTYKSFIDSNDTNLYQFLVIIRKWKRYKKTKIGPSLSSSIFSFFFNSPVQEHQYTQKKMQKHLV